MLIVLWTSELVYVQSFSAIEKKSFLLHLERPFHYCLNQFSFHGKLLIYIRHFRWWNRKAEHFIWVHFRPTGDHETDFNRNLRNIFDRGNFQRTFTGKKLPKNRQKFFSCQHTDRLLDLHRSINAASGASTGFSVIPLIQFGQLE